MKRLTEGMIRRLEAAEKEILDTVALNQSYGVSPLSHEMRAKMGRNGSALRTLLELQTKGEWK